MIDLTNIHVHISHDKMSAFLTVSRPEKTDAIERGDIQAALSNNKVNGGVIEAEIDRIVDNQLFDVDVLIAKGVGLEHGQDGHVEYMFEFDEELKPMVVDGGKVDYYNMNIIHPVLKGDVLCKLHKPTLGKDGFNVLGASLIARNGKPAQMPRGRNTQASEDGEQLISTIDGQIKRNGKNIDVIQEFEVKKDVDFSTGNIQFPGSVTVRGNVLSGFVIQSGGDITIFGLVEKASITAFGNIILHGGMTGQGGGVLRAGGDIFAKYVENSHITASGKVTAECIMHSAVRAGAGIDLIGRKGLLVGGSAKAREYIRAVTIGSQFETLTEVEVGSDPKMNDRLKDIKAEMLSHEEELKKVGHALSMFRNLEKSGVKLTPQKALVYDRMMKLDDELKKKLASLRTEHDGIETMIKKNIQGYVRVSNIIYSGVKVSIASSNTLLKEDLKYCSLKSDGDGIRVAPY